MANELEDLLKSIVGQRITDVRKMTDEEANEMYWSNPPYIVTLENGIIIIPQIDPEGNDGGTLLLDDTKSGKMYLL